MPEQLPMIGNDMPYTPRTNFATINLVRINTLPSILKRTVSYEDFKNYNSVSHNNVLFEFKSMSYLDLAFSHDISSRLFCKNTCFNNASK